MANATLVQSMSKGSTGTGDLAKAWTSNTTSGNTIVVIAAASGSTISSVTDSQNNTYTLIDSGNSSVGAAAVVSLWYSANITGGTTPTITTHSTSNDNSAFVAREYSGILAESPLDKSTGRQQLATTTPSSGNTGTTTSNDELVIGAAGNNGGGASYVAGSGFGNVLAVTSSGPGNATEVAMEDQNVNTTGAQNATFTSSTVSSYVIVATFIVQAPFSPIKHDDSTVTESLTMNVPVNISVLDASTVTDPVSVAFVRTVSVFDASTVTDPVTSIIVIDHKQISGIFDTTAPVTESVTVQAITMYQIQELANQEIIGVRIIG